MIVQKNPELWGLKKIVWNYAKLRIIIYCVQNVEIY